MEYIFGLTEGRRAIIYDEGNQIVISFIHYGRITNQAVLEREYHSELNAIAYGTKIYLAYLTVSHAIAWMEVGGSGRILLYANDSGRFHLANLKTSIINSRLVLLYESEILDKGLCRLQYINPLEDRKSHLLFEMEHDLDYQINHMGDKEFLLIKNDRRKIYYSIEENERGKYELREIRVMTDEELKQLQNDCTEASQNEFVKQYNELVDFTKQLQEEGKHWREMYYRNAQNSP